MLPHIFFFSFLFSFSSLFDSCILGSYFKYSNLTQVLVSASAFKEPKLKWLAQKWSLKDSSENWNLGLVHSPVRSSWMTLMV